MFLPIQKGKSYNEDIRKVRKKKEESYYEKENECSIGSGNRGGDTTAADITVGKESVEKDTAENGDKPYAGTTIRVLSMTGQISDALEANLEQFEEETGITVNLELYGEAQLREKCVTEFLAGSSTIDVFLMSPLQDMAAFSNNGWIEPLDTWVKDENFDWDDFSSAPMDQITIQSTGEIGALPLYSSVQLMYYRKDIFEEKNLTPPANYDELLEVCKALNDPENNFYAMACRGEKIALTSQFSPFLYGYGGSYFKDGTCAFNTPENLEAAKFYGNLLGNYAPEGILTAGYSQMTQLFNSGQVGMCIDAIALYQTLVDPNESAFYDKVGVAPIPEGPAGRQSYKQVVWGASIYSGSKNKEAAWKLIEYMSSKESMQIWMDTAKTAPVRSSLEEAYLKKNPVNGPMIMEAIEIGKGSPKVPYCNSVFTYVDDAMEQVFYGQLSPQDALNAAAEKVQEEIDNQ